MTLKPISLDAVPRALELVERYRLLNEPEQAASICHDVLAADPGNVEARRWLLLSLTDQLGQRAGTKLEDVEAVARELENEYERAYYVGIAYERWARCLLEQGAHLSLVGDWVKRAMTKYEAAEGLRPAGNDDALMRWNACARLLARVPRLGAERDDAVEMGD